MKNEPKIGVKLLIGVFCGTFLVFLIFGHKGREKSNPANSSSVTSSIARGQYFQSVTERDRKIDADVDREVDVHWRPMPGGNSKEDAARVTKDIRKVRTWEELKRVIEFHEQQGR